MAKLRERTPDRLVDRQRVGVLYQRDKEEVERLLRVTAFGQMPRQGQTCPPVLRVLFDEPSAKARETLRRLHADGERLESAEGEVRPVRSKLDHLFPNRHGLLLVAFSQPDVAEVQVGGNRAPVEVDGGSKPTRGLREILSPHRLQSDLVFEKREDRLALGLRVDGRELVEPLARVVRLQPLVLLLVKLLEVHERIFVLRIEPQHFVERLDARGRRIRRACSRARGRAGHKRVRGASILTAAATPDAR